MNIIECKSTREIPSHDLILFPLSATYTLENAEADYRRHYGMEPTKCYKWGNYVYFEKPEEMKNEPR